MKKIEKEEELFIPKTKHKGLKIVLAIVLLLGLIAGGYFLYQYKFNNPKTIINNVLEEAENNIIKNVKETKTDGKYYVDGHIKFESNISDNTFKILKDVEALFNGQVDLNDKLANLDFTTKYKEDKLVDFNLYYEDNATYLLLKDVYDKYIKFNSKEEVDETSSLPKVEISPQEAKTLLTSLIRSLREELNKLDFKKEAATISIDGKNIDVYNNYVELIDNEVSDFLKNFYTNLKNNQEFLSVIKNITGEDGKELIDEIIKSFNESEFKGIYKINFYTDKSLLNKKIVSVRQTISIGGVTISLNTDKISDDEIQISIAVPGIGYSVRIKKANSVVNVLLSINVGTEYINVDLSMSYESIKEVTKADVSKYKDADKITPKEEKEIKNKLKENQALLKLIDELNLLGKQEA